MNIVILGTGAMGGLFGAYLSKRNEVTLIDTKPELVEIINSEGMKVKEPDGSVTAYFPKASLPTSYMPKMDLVIVFVKALYSESALKANSSIIGPDTYIMTLQNGSGHEDILSKFADEEHIIIGTTQHNANVSNLGTSNHGGSGKTYIGLITGDESKLTSITEEFTACSIETYISKDVKKMVWDKMFTNVSVSALTGALQVPMGFIVKDEHAWILCCRLIKEAVDVAIALGMEFDYDEKVAQVKAVCENSPEGLTSIYADLKNGRRTEVDTISGSVVAAGEKCGVPVPNHSFLVNFIHAMEKRGGK